MKKWGRRLTVAFNHEGFDDIMTNQFKIGMTDPVADSCLGTSKEVVENSDFMSEEHEAINKM